MMPKMTMEVLGLPEAVSDFKQRKQLVENCRRHYPKIFFEGIKRLIKYNPSSQLVQEFGITD